MAPEFHNTEASAADAPFNPDEEPPAIFLARAASCDVTPRDRPVQLAGYASRATPTSMVLDPIEISAVLLECGSSRCLLLSFDLMIVGAELRDLIHARLQPQGFAPGEIVLLASHTHYAPATERACTPLGTPDARFVNDAAQAVENLVRKLLLQRPAQVCLDIHQGRLDHSINRRRYWPLPTFGRTYGFRRNSMTFAPNPAGVRDERVTVVLLRQVDDGQAIGTLWHYTCHPTAVVPDNVISADYPGAVRRALRQRFGEIPCVFAQGFCGDIRPNISISESPGLVERLRNILRTAVSGPMFGTPSAQDWRQWSETLAARVADIAQGDSTATLSPNGLQTGSARIPIGDFFTGSIPAKMLEVQIVRLGERFEIMALSAEVCVEWQRILDAAFPVPDGRLRLYVGYLGALFGYLPTATQIAEGGYEVEGFQPLFGLSGRFDSDKIDPAVTRCLNAAFSDIELTAARTRQPAVARK